LIVPSRGRSARAMRHFHTGDGLARRAKGRQQLGPPTFHVGMLWALDNIALRRFRP
jgi:hypothetical protein